LDTLAWFASTHPKRKLLAVSQKEILNFIKENEPWVIEGCYSELLKLAIDDSNELFFMNNILAQNP